MSKHTPGPWEVAYLDKNVGGQMKITFRCPMSPEMQKTYISMWIESGEMAGCEFIDLAKAKEILNQLQQAILHAEVPEQAEE